MCSVGLQVETRRLGCSRSSQQVQQAGARGQQRAGGCLTQSKLASPQFRPSAEWMRTASIVGVCLLCVSPFKY